MKIPKVCESKAELFMTCRKNNDAINKAVAKAKTLGFTNSECQPLIIEKMRIGTEFEEVKQKIMNEFLKCNIVELIDSWYAIICQEENGKQDILVIPFIPDNLQQIAFDFVKNKAKAKNEYDQFIKANMNHESLDRYKIEILRRQDYYLKTFFSCTDKVIRDGVEHSITAHCIRRWNERIRQASDDVCKENREEIVKELSYSFTHSLPVYQNDDGQFFLNKDDMVFFVVGNDNSILSLWRNKFGFSCTEIDKIATLMQLEHTNNVKKEFCEYQNKQNKVIAELEQQKKNRRETLKYLTEQIETLIALKNKKIDEQQNIGEQIAQIKTDINKKRMNLLKEEALLFKPHRMVTDEEEK